MHFSLKLAPFLIAVVAIVLVPVMLACSVGVDEVAERRPQGDAAIPAKAQLRPDELPLIESPVSPDGLQVILGTSDLGVGENRVGFVLTSTDSLVREPAATVSSTYYPGEDSEGDLTQTALAVFQPWPYGTRGLYTTRLNFDKPGRWALNITVLDAQGPSRKAQLFFHVRETASAPALGSPAVRSKNRTIDDVERLTQLSTGSLLDPELYETTIVKAVASGLPTVVVMASPAFCTNAVCGPQVEVLQQLKNKYRGQANFIHVDFYDNPEEIQGDLSRARLSPVVEEWMLPSSEWSFVIDRNGIVSARFEAFATLQELEQALNEVL